jgi:hypothetical protein
MLITTRTIAIEQVFAVAPAKLFRERDVTEELDDLRHVVVVLGVLALLGFRREQKVGS